MDLKVDGGSLTSTTEVEQPHWMGIDIHGPTDIDVDVLTAVHLHAPCPDVRNEDQGAWDQG